MPHLPKSIPTGNNHNIILHVEKSARDDADRLIQIGGEGVTAARHALNAIADLPPDIERAHRETFHTLSAMLGNRNIFEPAFRGAAGDFLLAVDDWRTRHGDDEDVLGARALVAKALEVSELLEDYLSAERKAIA